MIFKIINEKWSICSFQRNCHSWKSPNIWINHAWAYIVGIDFKNIEVSNDNFGKPSIKLKGSTASFLQKKIKTKRYSIYLSLSDDEPWAQATVIISYN